ncbi:MAG: hypothetical protein AVDCRST_MAG12-3629 [uncultured Rubrobacteraceae bacterium]|uniref:Uncharacterized protein n=1 Tax=uncultured Rubrobacteraceae bacterium TaxID=349277 RepID=A0A6J4TAP6_9ACTN|nr:MAG: hypothetical protein AVDCRST_MAG12-3629 [uncultured Rubrobacteraceae bacterium]
MSTTMTSTKSIPILSIDTFYTIRVFSYTNRACCSVAIP